MTDVFISYAREDSDFVRRIYNDLLQNERDAWVDWEDIPLTADWLAEAYAGIEGADAFLFVISPSSVSSGPCTLELEHALEGNKRLIPLLRQEVLDPEEQKHMHQSLSSHNWIRFRENDDYSTAFQSLLRAMDTDLDYIRAHTRYLVRASEWDSKGRDRSFLLVGNDLSAAERWLKDSETKTPKASDAQREYIIASRAEASRRRRLFLVTAMVILTMAVLALAAVFQGIQATRNADAARSAEATAHFNADQADSSALAAYAQQALYREHNADLAIVLALEANRLENVPALARTTLAQAAYAPGTRQVFDNFALYPDADMAITPDSQRVLSVSAEETLNLWELATGTVLQTWDFGDTNQQRPWTVTISPNGQQALVTLQDGSVFLLNLETGEQSQPWPYTAFARFVVFTPDGTGALVGYHTGSLILWDIATGTQRTEYPGIPDTTVYSIAISPDNARIAAGFDDGSILVWSYDNPDQVTTLTGHSDTVRSVAFSPDSTQILSGSHDQTVRLWDIATGEQIYQFRGHADRVRQVMFSTKPGIAFSASYDSDVIEWNLNTGNPINLYVGHVAAVYSVLNLPGDHVLTGSSDGTLRMWDIENGAEIRRFEGHISTVFSLATSPDGSEILSGSQDTSLILWERTTGEILQTLCCHNDRVWGVDFSPDGSTALSASRDRTLILWDLATGQKIRTFSGHDDGVWSVVFSPDGRTALSGSRDSTLILWDVETGRIIRRFRGHTTRVYGIDISPDGRYALSASSDKTIILWDIETGQALKTLEGHKSVVYDVAFSPDGAQALSGSLDLTMILWDLNSGQKIRQFTGHTADVTSVAFSQDGHRGLSGSFDNSVRLWNLDTGAETLLYAGHIGGVWDVAFSPDNRTILSASEDTTLREWRIDTFDELTTWTYANRYIISLTCEQRELYRIAIQCGSQGVYPSRTPYLTTTPDLLASVTPTAETVVQAVNPSATVTPSLMPLPALELNTPLHAELLPGNRDIYVYSGQAGEVITISVAADKPANDVTDQNAQLEQGVMDTNLIAFMPDGSILAQNDDQVEGQTNSLLEGLALPADGTYWLQINSPGNLRVGGGYTLTVYAGSIPTATPTNPPTP